MSSFSAALLISTYNWPEALALVLQSVASQTMLPAKILIADDGSDERTKFVIDEFKKKISIPVEHIWHSDQGFRKTLIMNKAIAECTSDYIIQIDGDIILHPMFIADHISEAEIGYYIKGSRGLLNSEKTQELLNLNNLTVSLWDPGLSNKFNILRFPSLAPILRRRSQRSHDLKGCNCAFWRKDFIAVNGYNNNLKGWGHEDIELAARLVNAGVLQKRVKLKAICFHLHHKINERSQENDNFQAYREVIKMRHVKALNGYRQLVEDTLAIY